MKRIPTLAVASFLCLMTLIPCISVNAVEDGPERALPQSHLIADVPFHAQFNGIFCGVGSMAIVLDYLGPEIDQKEIADVARTTNAGTYPADVVRTGQFSKLSSAKGDYFHGSVPTEGFKERSMGYAAFGYCSDTFWLGDLKALIAADIPVIVLMTYSPGGTASHWRVVIGYDDAQQRVYFCDTWGRDILKLNDSGIISWSYHDFEIGWNYRGEDTRHPYCEHPYFGAIFLPWSVDISVNGKAEPGSTVEVEADITYPCPSPFDVSQFPAKDAFAEISLPDGMTLVGSQQQTMIGSLQAGAGVSVTWKAQCDQGIPQGASIEVTAAGIISGSLPEAFYWGNSDACYPGYSYTDLIGGMSSVAI